MKGTEIKPPPAPTNPDNTPCFSYQKQTVSGVTYVTDVAITLTVQTNKVDPITKRVQTETKALLNVAPRNVFNVWQLASLGFTNRVQPMPATSKKICLKGADAQLERWGFTLNNAQEGQYWPVP